MITERCRERVENLANGVDTLERQMGRGSKWSFDGLQWVLRPRGIQWMVRARVTISTDVNEDTGRKRKRHADAQLAYSAGTLHKLQNVVGVWYHTPTPWREFSALGQ